MRLRRSIQNRQAAYRDLFCNQLDPGIVDEIRSVTHGGFVLGLELHQKEIAALLGWRARRGRPGRSRKSKDDADQHELGI